MEYKSLQFHLKHGQKQDQLKKEDQGEVAQNQSQSHLEVTLYNLYTFSIPLEEIKRICPRYRISRNSIHFEMENQHKAEGRFIFLLSKYIVNLKNKISGFPAVYVHKNAGIPLFGLQFLGILDKGSGMIEVKTITNCNMNCIFCSVNEGPDTNKQVDFVVEEDYIIEELAKLLAFKKQHHPDVKFNIWINPHGEPLLYAPIVSLCHRIATIENVGEIHIITNGVLLNKPLIDSLAENKENKKMQLNISISGFSEQKAKEMMGSNAYSVSRVLEMAEYAAQKMPVTITPVYVEGYNDAELEKIIEFAQKSGCKIAIQKFCYNKFGRNPIKEKSWDDFFALLKELEKKHQLILLGELGKLQHITELPKPFKKEDSIVCSIVSHGRMRKDKICVAKQRAILVPNCEKQNGKIKIKITQTKYNLFMGSLIK